jgi:hypothetical protein
MLQEVGAHTRALHIRITCESLDKRGLASTRPQATHLWNVDGTTCARALEQLVVSGFLRNAAGTYRWDDAGYRAK